ncbi:MAG: hypothetical protein AB7N65_26735, partial [Vicinamibacterales bacterium]
MRSSAAKLALGVAAWFAFAAASVLLFQSEQQLTARRNALRAFDVIARETATAFAGLKSAQQGYVAPGQGLGTWMARVDTLLTAVTARLDELESVAASGESRRVLTEVAESLGDLRAIDKRARQYVNTDQPVMAADVIFSEGGETSAIAGRQVEAARQAEYLAFDATEDSLRRRQVYAISAAFAVGALAVGVLVLLPVATAAHLHGSTRVSAGEQDDRPRSV